MLSYLDAATGSMIAAALAGGAAGVGVLLRMYGNRFLGVFSKKRRLEAQRARDELVSTAPYEA
jgi:hypothetical protein